MSDERDDQLIAYHEAGHAVAMFKLGVGIRRVSIEPQDGLGGICEPGTRSPDVLAGAHRRADIEHYGIVLQAGSVAERLLRPNNTITHAGIDHRNLHFLLQAAEDDSAVQITWCTYVWQRTYALLADAWQWRLVKALAGELRERQTLSGLEAKSFLEAHAEGLKHDPTMPNAVLLGGPPVNVRAPWHAAWYRGEDEKPQTRFEVLEHALNRERRTAATPPPCPALAALSGRARNALVRAGITRIGELAFWNERKLRGLWGVGTGTFREIEASARAAGVTLQGARVEEVRHDAR